MEDAANDLRIGELRLSILTALDAALHRRDEVSAAIAAAASRDDAVAAVQQLLDVEKVPANAVLTITWDRMTADGRRMIAEELADVAAQVGVVVVPHQAWTKPGLFDRLS